MKSMHLNSDSLLALGSGVLTGEIVAQHDPSTDRIITQVIVPFVAAVLVPFFKELSVLAIQYLKQKMKEKKAK